jgi:hypothetical protein
VELWFFFGKLRILFSSNIEFILIISISWYVAVNIERADSQLGMVCVHRVIVEILEHFYVFKPLAQILLACTQD